MPINFKNVFMLRFMHRKVAVLSLVLACSVIALSIGAGARLADRAAAIIRPPKPRGPNRSVPRATPLSRVNLQTFVAPGLQVAFEGAWADKDSGRQVITFNVLRVGSEKPEETDVVLVDMTPEATISKIERRRLTLDFSDSKGTATFTSEFPHQPGHTQTLAVTAVGSRITKQEVDAQELIASLVGWRLRGLTTTPRVTERTKEQIGFTPDVCYESFRLSRELARSLGLTARGNVCDRYRQSFAIAFGPAVQPKSIGNSETSGH